MFTTETGIGVVVMVVFAAIWLAFMLWEDWGQAGKTACRWLFCAVAGVKTNLKF